MKKKTTAKTLSLLDQWIKAKATEEAAKMLRLDLEAELSLRPEIEIKPEGSNTLAIDNFKIETKGVLIYSLDKEIWDSIKESFDEELSPVVFKPTVNESKAKKLRSSYPELWLVASKAISSKPGKPGFKVTKLGEV